MSCRSFGCSIMEARFRACSADCPPPSPVAHLVISCCLLGLSIFASPCRAVIISSSHFPVGCLLGSSALPRLARSFRSPRAMSSSPCPIALRAVRSAVINRPALLVGWLGVGRDGRLFRHLLSVLPLLIAWACGACVCSGCGGLLCLLGYRPFMSVLWWRNCIYDLSHCYNTM